MKNPRPGDEVHSRRKFVRNMTLGAAYLGSAAASDLAAEVAELTKAGAHVPGVAIMGLGLYATGEIAPAFRHTRACRLAGVITGSREKGESWSREHGFPSKNVWSYETMHQIAENKDIDIVYVITPNGLHAEHVIAMAQAGKHVICEKPMANTVAECDAMLAACRKANTKLSVGYRLHYEPRHAELERLARDRDFGILNTLSGEHSWTFRRRAWRIEKPLSGGGPLMDVGIYVIQAACRAALSQPHAVTARELPKTRPELFDSVEESIEWTMEFPGDVTCRAASSYSRDAAFFRAEGDKGWIHMDPAYAYRGIKVSTSQGTPNYPEVPQQALQMDHFAAEALTGRESPVSGQMGRDHMRIIESIYQSAADGGRRVQIKP
ncbi:MAG TPA: Gfo/Idh/MocA family oxidoreductase [Opitutaceae bacterium]|jgi:glucose-fructose oxidoreductase|nr:Gfo/Idh/MocA family oxidoreductase [Opitutaceae bacterium]